MRILITGGAGFIGFHSVIKLSNLGHELVIIDNLSRQGSQSNLEYIQKNLSGVTFVWDDLSNLQKLRDNLRGQDFDFVLHLAAQTAVTTSLANPKMDFDSNAQGSLNLLEWARQKENPPHLIYASTNKVYGSLPKLPLIEGAKRYGIDGAFRNNKGISETEPLEFRSPYGCSKGYADQAFLDYHESFGLPTTVFRQSCIYGSFQHGVEDQGWVAWMALAALNGQLISIFGNGKQVRDLLYVDDLVDAYVSVLSNPERAKGRAFNLGGGYENSISIIEYLELLQVEFGLTPKYELRASRIADQKYFVSDNSYFETLTGWSAATNVRNGVSKMVAWVKENRNQTR